MNRKNLVYAALVLIIVCVFILVFSGQFEKLTGGRADFVVSDTSLVSRIQIIGNDTVDLRRTADGWTVNSRYKADPTAVNNFLFAFKRLEINGMMKGEDVTNLPVRRILIWRGRKVKRLRYYPSARVPLMQYRGSVKVYRVGVSGLPAADLSQITSDRPAYWKDKMLISLAPDEISRIKVVPAEKWGRGFVIERQGDSLLLSTLQGVVVPDSRRRS